VLASEEITATFATFPITFSLKSSSSQSAEFTNTNSEPYSMLFGMAKSLVADSLAIAESYQSALKGV
jgi:hypothetical protein